MDLLKPNSIDLARGPSGRAVAQLMDQDLITALYEHTSLERSASAQYFAMSLWLFERELRGFFNHFHKESLAESDHALTFAKYIIARGQTIVLDEIPEPLQKWDSVEELITYGFQMEADVTASIHQIYSLAERCDDTRTTVFLDPIVDEQIKTEDEMAYILGKVRFAKDQPSALLIIDNELNK